MKIPFNSIYLTGKEEEYVKDALHSGRLSGNNQYGIKVITHMINKHSFKDVFLTPSGTSALEMGAIVGNASKEDRHLLYEFGQHIGIAFQIQDDILDLYADPEKFGKQVGGDVISNKKTLLNLKAMELANAAQKNQLAALSSELDLVLKVAQTKELYSQIGAKESCEVEMQAHYNFAMNALDQIQLPKENKKPLIALSDYLMVRNS